MMRNTGLSPIKSSSTPIYIITVRAREEHVAVEEHTRDTKANNYSKEHCQTSQNRNGLLLQFSGIGIVHEPTLFSYPDYVRVNTEHQYH